jgi:hypothetical protein
MTKRERQQLSRAIDDVWIGPEVDRGWATLFGLRDGGDEVKKGPNVFIPQTELQTVQEALEWAEAAFAQKVHVGRCMHDRSDWETLLTTTKEALALVRRYAKPFDREELDLG